MSACFAGGIQQRVDFSSAASVAGAAAGIFEGLPFLGNELPVVAGSPESELEHAECGGVADFAVGFHWAKRAMVLAASANDELADAADGISNAIRRLRRKSFVVMVVAADNHIGVGIVERVPQRFDRQVVAVRAA